MPATGSLTYPTNQLLAVVDDPAVATRLVEALNAAGFEAADITLLQGAEGAERFRGSGRVAGRWTRLVRMVQFMSMDQMPDFRTYEAALRNGRAVLAVRIRQRGRLEQARDVLLGSGAHFLNFFGRFATEEVAPWRGAEPPLPGYMRR